ncbi:hypothetical protein Pelo_990 [Pelomyxa schiedti]|nr:hypothetical protein Pelo_990 [Pelomyxa schiedti]
MKFVYCPRSTAGAILVIAALSILSLATATCDGVQPLITLGAAATVADGSYMGSCMPPATPVASPSSSSSVSVSVSTSDAGGAGHAVRAVEPYYSESAELYQDGFDVLSGEIVHTWSMTFLGSCDDKNAQYMVDNYFSTSSISDTGDGVLSISYIYSSIRYTPFTWWGVSRTNQCCPALSPYGSFNALTNPCPALTTRGTCPGHAEYRSAIYYTADTDSSGSLYWFGLNDNGCDQSDTRGPVISSPYYLPSDYSKLKGSTSVIVSTSNTINMNLATSCYAFTLFGYLYYAQDSYSFFSNRTVSIKTKFYTTPSCTLDTCGDTLVELIFYGQGTYSLGKSGTDGWFNLDIDDVTLSFVAQTGQAADLMLGLCGVNTAGGFNDIVVGQEYETLGTQCMNVWWPCTTRRSRFFVSGDMIFQSDTQNRTTVQCDSPLFRGQTLLASIPLLTTTYPPQAHDFSTAIMVYQSSSISTSQSFSSPSIQSSSAATTQACLLLSLVVLVWCLCN